MSFKLECCREATAVLPLEPTGTLEGETIEGERLDLFQNG